MCQKFLPVLVLLLTTAAPAAYAADSQIWNTIEVKALLQGPWSIRMEEELRILVEKGHSLEYSHTEVGLIYQHTDWLATNVNYMYAQRKNKSDRWEREHRPSISFLITPLLHEAWEVEYRNRTELIMRKENRDIYRFRNRINVTYRTDWTRFKISPFVTEEFFIDTDQPRFKFNRYGGGLQFHLTENISSRIYYLRQDSVGRAEQQKADVIGISVNFSF